MHVPDDQLYIYVSPFHPAGSRGWDSNRRVDDLKMQLRCRGISHGKNKHWQVVHLLNYLKDKGLVDDAFVPIPPVVPVAAAAAAVAPIPPQN